jgi:DNA-binding transcriptional ArsR family regulator
MQRINENHLEWSTGVLKSIAHPKRMEILDLLSENNKLSVTDICTKLNMEQAVASQHLILLKNKGVLGSVKKGKSIFYYTALPELLNILDVIGKCSDKLFNQRAILS